MIVSFECFKCGANKPEDGKYYNGSLGYEAMVCRKCGTSHDHFGVQPPDAWSLGFVGLPVPLELQKKQNDNKRKKRFRADRARTELKIVLLTAIENFKSKEEKGYVLTENDVLRTLAEMLSRKTQNLK